MTEEQNSRLYLDMLKSLDMLYEIQVTVLEGLTRGSCKEMEDGIKQIEVLTDLAKSGNFPYQEKDKTFRAAELKAIEKGYREQSN